MKNLLIGLICCLAVSGYGAGATNVQSLAKFGLVSSMSSTDLVAIEINLHPRGIPLANFTQGLATVTYVNAVTNSSVTTTVLNNASNALLTIIISTNTALITIINNASNAVYQAGTNIAGLFGSNNVRVAAGTATTVATSSSGGLMIYTVGSSLDTNVIGTNTAGILGSNNVRVAAGANVTVTPTASAGVMTYTVAGATTVSTLTITNSTVTSNQAYTLVSIFPVSNGTNFQADMAQAESLIQMTNNLFFQLSTNRTAGQVKYAAFQIESGNTNWTLAFNSSWKWLGTTNNPPTTISSNKVAVLGLKCYGTSETNVVAAYAVQP